MHTHERSFDHVLWLGGGTGGGKTTVARLLASRHGLRSFPIDAFWYAHDARLGLPDVDPDEQWLRRSPERQAQDFEERARLGTRLVLEDLAALPADPPILVEGPQIFPDELPDDASAVFVVSTPEFQRAALAPRPMPSSDPERALANRLVKDRLYADVVAQRARVRGFPVVVVDGTRTPEQIVGDIERLVEIPTGAGDLAGARRWENEAIAANVHAWLASRQAPRDASFRIAFACECGERGCTQRVDLTLDEYAARQSVRAH